MKKVEIKTTLLVEIREFLADMKFYYDLAGGDFNQLHFSRHDWKKAEQLRQLIKGVRGSAAGVAVVSEKVIHLYTSF